MMMMMMMMFLFFFPWSKSFSNTGCLGTLLKTAPLCALRSDPMREGVGRREPAQSGDLKDQQPTHQP